MPPRVTVKEGRTSFPVYVALLIFEIFADDRLPRFILNVISVVPS